MTYKTAWDNRYRAGQNSGSGSYGILADFKAEIINRYIEENDIETVLDIGCGDGNQLLLLKCKQYIGVDVSPTAINICKKTFSQDNTKKFSTYSPNGPNNLPDCDLVLCLDVLYHIIPESEFIQTLDDVFSHAKKAVILYTVLKDIGSHNEHIYTRDILIYLTRYQNWEIKEIIYQRYPRLSGAYFIILEPT